MDVTTALQNIGLSKQEVAIYLSALKLGVAKASDIAKKADVKREAAYYTLRALQEKGFISEFIRNGVNHYSAIEPKLIPKLLLEEKDRALKSVQTILPELSALQEVALTHPTIEFYQGIEGYQAINLLLFERKDQIICGYATEDIVKFYLGFSSQLHEMRRAHKLFLRIITKKIPLFQEARKNDKKDLREIRFNDQAMEKITGGFYIVHDGVAILRSNGKDHLGIWIRDPDLAKLQRQIFEQMWKQSE